MTPVDVLAQANAVLSTAAFAGLLWRLFGRWPMMTRFATIIVGLLASLELIVAMAVARRAALGGEFNEVQLLILAHTVATLAVVATWPALVRAAAVKAHHEARIER